MLANKIEEQAFVFEIGSPDARVWRPLGSYTEAEVGYFWNVPGTLQLEIKPDHPMAGYLVNCRYRVIHIRTWRNGKKWVGRLMNSKVKGRPGQERITLVGVGYLFWLLRTLAWVQPLFPPEVQIALTGKQDMMIGPPDFVFKYFAAKNWTRMSRPIYCALPLKYDVPELPNITDISDLEELLGLIADVGLIGIQCRFPPLDEAYKQSVDNLDLGLSMDLWTKADGPSPEVFNARSLGILGVLLGSFDFDNFLRFDNAGNPLALPDPASWGKITKDAGYVFDTHTQRPRQWMEWRTDSGWIEEYERNVRHLDALQVIVGGKSPDMVNKGIEWAANLAIQALAAAITTAMGLPGVGGIVVGDLFDNIFFAYQGFENPEPLTMSDEFGSFGGDDGEHFFGEVFGDNSAAWAMDSFAVGQDALKKASGEDSISITVVSGGPDGRGFQFGEDDGIHRRYLPGDIMTFWDRGQRVENFVSSVKINDRPGERMLETVAFGPDEPTKSVWERLVGQFKNVSQFTRGIANSV
jgi:hypothetical protein